MSVTLDVNIKVDTTTLKLGTVKFWGFNNTIVGDGTGGSYFMGFVADRSLFTMFPGRNYWVMTGVTFTTGGALVNPATYFIWFPREWGAPEWAVYSGSGMIDTVSDGGTNRLWTDARHKHGYLPHRWFALDDLPTSSVYVARTRVDPNTNLVSVGVQITGLICNEDYVLRHGLFLPS